MEIQQIKTQLSLQQVLEHYGLTPNKNHMLNCPFHEDKTASLQVNLAKNYYKCHACGKHGDQIQFVQDKENSTKHEALLKCASLISPLASEAKTKTAQQPIPKPLSPNHTELFQTLKAKFNQSSKAKDYAKQRNLDPTTLEIGYNTGKEFEKLKCCLIFPLKNESDQIVGLYGRSIYDNPEAKHFYTTSREGLYPHYPKPETTKLILTEAIIDCASLLPILSKAPFGGWGTLSCFGTNGLLIEHFASITKWIEQNQNPSLEIIFFFDGDTPGQEAVQKHAKQLAIINEKLVITKVETPENEDINSLLQGHTEEILIHLIENRIPINTIENDLNTKIQNIEDNPNLEDTEVNYREVYANTPNPQSVQTPPSGVGGLENEHLKIEVLGDIDYKDLSALRVTIAITNKKKENYPSRQNLNLYNDEQVEKIIRKIAEKTELGTTILNKAIQELIDKLEKHRKEAKQEKPQTKARYLLRTVTQTQEREALQTLKEHNLKEILIEKLQQTGIIGEDKNALFLFLILLSHKMKRTLHAMVQGTSGSGKSHLISKVADTMYDQNKIKRFTRVTDKSFYNYGEYDLQNTGIILEDYDGLSLEAEMAWRELQSNNKLSSSVSQKNEQTGEIHTGEKYVFGPIASLVATTKFRIYEDNESRVFTIAIDESEAQTEKVLEYMAKKASKEITQEQEEKIQIELQNMVYLLKPYQVQNPYRLELPKNVKHRRRLTQMLHDFIEQVTILYQYQRQVSFPSGRSGGDTLIAQVQDLEIAVDLMFNSIVIKADELDGILRQFYENLKEYVEKKGKEYEFTQREIRQEFRISKTQTFRYFTELQELEYIHKSNIGSRNTYNFQISYWDNIEKLRAEIRQHLQAQIDQYKPKEEE
jgi:DNA primase